MRFDKVEGHLGDDRDRLSPEIDIELMPHVGRASPRWNTSGRYCHDRTSPVTTDTHVLPLGSLRRAGRERGGVVAGLRKPIRLAELIQEVNNLTQSLEV
jgi:hypothetical protein